MLSVLLPYNKTRSINKSTIFFCHGEFFREINFTKIFRENDFTEIHNNETNHGESIFKNGLFFRVLAHIVHVVGILKIFLSFFFILLLVIIFPHI